MQTGSLITGELYVAFEYFPNAPKVKVDWSQDPLQLPVSNAGLASLEAKLDSILTKVNRMPLEAMGTGVKNLIVTLNQTLKDADTMIKRVDAEFLPEGTKTLEELHRAIADGDRRCWARIPPVGRICAMSCRRWPAQRGPSASWWTICNDTLKR